MASARDVAVQVLARVEEGAFASEALAGALVAAQLAAADRALATELVYGVLRQRIRLDRALEALLDRKPGRAMREPIGNILSAGAYQILFLDRVPAHAAVNEAVQAARKARGQRVAGFVNAVLRRLAREGEPSLPSGDTAEALSIRTATPAWIVEQVRKVRQDVEATLVGLSAGARLGVRVNRARATLDEVRQRLAAELGSQPPEANRPGGPSGVVASSPLCPEALLVSGMGNVAASPSFREGLWTVQDPASQLVGHLVSPRAGQRVLDACAGSGGKTTHLVELAPGVEVDAVDVSAANLERGRQNAERLGCAGIRFIHGALGQVADELAPSYDAVVVDAPCTGLGVLRRHPEAKHRVRPEDVEKLAVTQRELLELAAARVAPGGVLVYSVCTFTEAEGPAQIEALRARMPELRLAPPGQEFPCAAAIESTGTLRTWPHLHEADAFFAARLVRARVPPAPQT